MKVLRQSRRCVTPTVWLGIALGIAIVVWGACYKMEQYPLQGHAFRVMSPAKALTEEERPVRAIALRTARTIAWRTQRLRSHLPAGSVPSGTAPLYPQMAEVLLPAGAIWDSSRAEFTYFSFRPPPAVFHS